jgi:predicted esterase
MEEHHIEVAKTARYFTLGDAGPGPRQLWMVCHGYRQLAKRFMRRFHALDDGTRLIVAPEGLSRFYLDDGTREHVAGDPIGSTWMTREDRINEIHDYVRYLDAVLAEVCGLMTEPPEELIVLGFSQGAQTACRWVVSSEADVSRLICWGAYPPDDLDSERGPGRLADTDLVLVRGLTDPYVSEEGHQRREARLAELEVPFRSLVHPGGHDLDPDLLVELAE